MCDSMELARSPAARLWLEAGPPLANVMENRRNFMAVFSLSPLFSFVPLWRMTLDILFTYLTMDERNEGWGSKTPLALKGILISKNELKLIHFCLQTLKLDGHQTHHGDGDISETDAISCLIENKEAYTDSASVGVFIIFLLIAVVRRLKCCSNMWGMLWETWGTF